SWEALDLSSGYWLRSPEAPANTQAIDEFLQKLADPRDKRDALRALRGSVLRTELYALDDSPRRDRPFTVTEKIYGLREESSPDNDDLQRRRIFFPHLRVQRTTQW